MGIVRFALRFPHTFFVMALAILFLGVSAIVTAPKDIFPVIDIPVVTVIWQYTGLTPREMEARVTTYSEYSISANVNNIRDMESQTLSGFGGSKDLLSAQRECRSGNRADRVRDQFDPRPHAARHPAAGHRPVQRVERSGAADQSFIRQDERAAALRLWHLSPAPGAGADKWHHPADPLRRQVSADHGRSRPRCAACQRSYPERHRQRGQCREPDTAVRRREDRQYAIHRERQRHGAVDRRAQQHPDPSGRRHDRLFARCRACPRRLGGTAEHRAYQWPAFSSA